MKVVLCRDLEESNYAYDHIINCDTHPPSHGFIMRWRPWDKYPGKRAWIVVCINPWKLYLFGVRIF